MIESEEMRIVDLGCGKGKHVGDEDDFIIGVDVIKLQGVNVIADFKCLGWPFKKDQFDLVICKHVLEHLDDIPKALEEIWRIGKRDGVVRIWSQYFANYSAYTDPTHKHFFTTESFDYFDPTTDLSRNWPFLTNAIFKMANKRFIFGRPFNVLEKLFNSVIRFYECFLAYLFPAREVYFD